MQTIVIVPMNIESEHKISHAAHVSLEELFRCRLPRMSRYGAAFRLLLLSDMTAGSVTTAPVSKKQKHVFSVWI